MARFFLGLGESGNFPAAIKATAEWFPPKERSLATGIFNSGAGVGAILAPAGCSLGGSSFWLAVCVSDHGRFQRGVDRLVVDPISQAAVRSWTGAAAVVVAPPAGPLLPWWHLLGYRQTWGFVLGKFLTDPVWWFFLFWLPGYFSSRFELDLRHIGLPLVVVYVISTIGSVYGGWLPRAYLKLGMTLKAARLAAMLTCACLVVPISLAGGLHSMWTAVGLLSLATSAHQGWSANIFTTVSDMFPAEYVGTVTSFGQVAGAVGGAIFPPVAGHILQFTHSYVPLFLYSGSAYLIALVLLRTLAPGLKRAIPGR